MAFSIRPFKNEYITPDSTWTVIQWTLGSTWIFWNQSEWLISITDWTNWYTIMDKNLGATTVYNDWDTLSETNCGKYYQWWNNYWFPRTWSVTTSSTQVDASTYWPWNYYESNIFITSSEDRSSVRNNNLWWRETWVVILENVIANTGVLSVNGQTGDVIVPWWTDYTWVKKSWSSIELWLRTLVNTESNITLITPSSIKDWEEYVLRCINNNSYTLSLWEWFTNPFWVDLTLSFNATDQFVFLAVQWTLELQPQVIISNWTVSQLIAWAEASSDPTIATLITNS